MYAGSGRAGDLAGDTLQCLADSVLTWTDDSETALVLHFDEVSGLPSGHAFVVCVEGVAVAWAPTLPYTFTVPTPGTVPNVAVIVVSGSMLNGYQPLGGYALANVTYLLNGVAPRGMYAGPVDELADLLASCASVQGLLQVTTTGRAKDKIIQAGLKGDHVRPLISVKFSDGTRESSARGHFIANAELNVNIEIPISWKVTVASIVRAGQFICPALANFPLNFFQGFTAYAGDVAMGLVIASGTDGTLTVPGYAPAGNDTVTLAPATIEDEVNFFLGELHDIQNDLENGVLASGLNIHSIRLGDYGRVLPQNDEEYMGGKLEMRLGA